MIKPGWLTTEWFGTLSVHALSFFIVYLGTLQSNPTVQAVTAIAGAVLSLLKQAHYQNGRNGLKSDELEAKAEIAKVAATEGDGGKLPPFLQGNPRSVNGGKP